MEAQSPRAVRFPTLCRARDTLPHFLTRLANYRDGLCSGAGVPSRCSEQALTGDLPVLRTAPLQKMPSRYFAGIIKFTRF